MQLSKDTKRFEEAAVDELVERHDKMFDTAGGDSDFAAESLMGHMYANPLGKLLRIISTLPEVRHEKVDYARTMIEQTEEELDFQMDLALDMVLEELITEN